MDVDFDPLQKSWSKTPGSHLLMYNVCPAVFVTSYLQVKVHFLEPKKGQYFQFKTQSDETYNTEERFYTVDCALFPSNLPVCAALF